MTKDQQRNDGYSPREAQERLEAGIRGARKVGHREMKDIPGSRVRSLNVQHLLFSQGCGDRLQCGAAAQQLACTKRSTN
jgi:hypothetical protein